jgi:cytidylate kinase
MLARKLGYFYLDTGLLYRALTLQALRNRVDLQDGSALAELARKLRVVIKPPSVSDGRQSDVRIGGRDVSLALRSREVDANVSQVSAHAEVRASLVEIQRSAARMPGTVVAGRDIGTVIFPGATLKIYLEATSEERARRRLRQGGAWSEAGLVQTLRDIQRRDQLDATRDVAPLQRAQDALTIDTDDLTPQQVVNQIIEIYEARGDIDE